MIDSIDLTTDEVQMIVGEVVPMNQYEVKSTKSDGEKVSIVHQQCESIKNQFLKIIGSDVDMTCACCRKTFSDELKSCIIPCGDGRHRCCEPCCITLLEKNQSCPFCRKSLLKKEIVYDETNNNNVSIVESTIHDIAETGGLDLRRVKTIIVERAAPPVIKLKKKKKKSKKIEKKNKSSIKDGVLKIEKFYTEVETTNRNEEKVKAFRCTLCKKEFVRDVIIQHYIRKHVKIEFV